MTLPYLEYGSLIYASGNKLQLQRLQTLQNMNTRICFDLPNRMRTSELHTIANLNLLEDRRNTQLLMYTRSRDEKFIDDRHLHTRRVDAPLLKVPNTLSSTSQKAVAYRGATHGNMLPSELRGIATKDAFKNYQNYLKPCYDILALCILLTLHISSHSYSPIFIGVWERFG